MSRPVLRPEQRIRHRERYQYRQGVSHGMWRALGGFGADPGRGRPGSTGGIVEREVVEQGVRRSTRAAGHRLGPRKERRSLVEGGSRVPGANAECEMRNGDRTG